VTNALRVILSGTAPTNLVVELVSSMPARMSVPATVTVPAGQSFARVPLTLPDNNQLDGPSVVTLTASAPGLKPASVTLKLADNDVHHFDVTGSGVAVTNGVGFSVTVTARTADGSILFSQAGPLQLQATGALGRVELRTISSGGWQRGTWRGQLAVENGANVNVRLIADDGAGHLGVSTPFEVFPGAGLAPRLGIHRMVQGDIQLQLATLLGGRYRIEASSTPGEGPWVPVVTNLNGTGGIVLSSDASGASRGQRFYRAAREP
jgi:hypothetical protein